MAEQQRRCSDPAVEISAIRVDTPVPENMNSFWPSVDNKSKLQWLLYDWLQQHACNRTTAEIVLSGMFDYDGNIKRCVQVSPQNVEVVSHLESDLEEADHRIILHIMNAIIHGG